MATKTFKIGLSNTDKQNMAQDVYERLLALTFPKYDSAESYNVGDFVVYNDQLYKCIGSTSGAWDSTKWQLATLNDLLTDIESAVAFVNDKANVDGNYPTMTVGVADQLSPYDDESGDDQDEPFSFQATGTGNGSQPDFSTGAIALMKEKQGNTVCVNQLVKTTDLEPTKTVNDVVFTNNSNGTFTIVGTASSSTYTPLTGSFNVIPGHNYYVGKGKNVNIYDGYATHGTNGIIQPTNTSITLYSIISIGTVVNETLSILLIDLTQWFNGDVPQDLLDNPSNFFRYYQGSLDYNTGELVNADGRYIKCIGRQQWDEEWEVGGIDSQGQDVAYASGIRSIGYTTILPSVEYYIKLPTITGLSMAINFYDKDHNFISLIGKNGSGTFTTPTNARYIRINLNDKYGTTYNNDITISIYYEDESGYDQYYPYEVLTNNDTGTEELRSAGSVKDYKTPDGIIHRLVGSYTFTGNETWNFDGRRWITVILPADAPAQTTLTTKNASLSVNTSVNWGTDAYSYNAWQVSNRSLYYRDTVNYGDSDHSPASLFPAGTTLYYELAEPTTEQGTSFSENLVIDDFGSMDFQGTNGVPQGNLIFYPVDYKAFIDTLYDYTEGTPSELVKQSERTSDKSAQATLDTALQNAIGGTLRQCLCLKETLDFDNTDFVDLGELSWNKTSGKFYAEISNLTSAPSWNTKPKMVCTSYKIVGSQNIVDTIEDNSLTYVNNTAKNIMIYDISKSSLSATQFKNAMKNVLLAYEKASS